MKDIWNSMYSNYSHLLLAFTLLAGSFVSWHNKRLILPLVAQRVAAAKKTECLLNFIANYIVKEYSKC